MWSVKEVQAHADEASSIILFTLVNELMTEPHNSSVANANRHAIYWCALRRRKTTKPSKTQMYFSRSVDRKCRPVSVATEFLKTSSKCCQRPLFVLTDKSKPYLKSMHKLQTFPRMHPEQCHFRVKLPCRIYNSAGFPLQAA